MKILVTGAGGFIGGHLIARLKEHLAVTDITALDHKQFGDWLQIHSGVLNQRIHLDMSTQKSLISGYDIVFHLAAEMGGMPYISTHNLSCLQDIDGTRALIRQSVGGHIGRIFLASSACVYPSSFQHFGYPALEEELAFYGEPENGYGMAKLFQEKMLEYARRESGISCSIARFFNVYGPKGDLASPRAKAPAAISMKIAHAQARNQPSVQLFGTGAEIRSFLHIDDCVTGIVSLVDNGTHVPVNLASEECLTISAFSESVAERLGYAGKIEFDGRYAGVSSRIPCIDRARRSLSWSPSVSLDDGMTEILAEVQSIAHETLV